MNIYKTPTIFSGVSFLHSTYSKGTPTNIPWDALVDMIMHDEQIKAKTEDIRTVRANGTEKEYARAKSTVGAFIPAAQFMGGRKQEHITALTGVSMVDLDHVPADSMAQVLEAVHSDPHTFIAYTTTSGEGVRILFRYTSRRPEIAYLDAWRWGNEYYAMITGMKVDEATKDPTRLSFLCHDADCHYNPNSVAFEVITNAEALDEMTQLEVPSGQEAATLAQRIADRLIPFVEGNRHRNLLYRAFLLNKMGMAETDIAQALMPFAVRGEKEARDLAAFAAKRGTADFGTWKTAPTKSHNRKRLPLAQATKASGLESSAKAPKPTSESKRNSATPEEIRQYLDGEQKLRYNNVKCEVEIFRIDQQSYVAMNDRIKNALWHECQQALGKYVRMADFDAELNSVYVKDYNPLVEYLDNLPQWDGTDHIGQLAARVKVKNGTTLIPVNRKLPFGDAEPIFTYCFRKWFVGMVASWLNPKVMNETILTLIGEQGMYKSTFCRRLLPPELEVYFLAKGNSSHVSKDDKLAVASHALIDFEEIDTMKDAELNVVKALVTTETINERAPYARNREQLSHLASFCATGNNRNFLTDLTGNRRWLPFEVECIDSPYSHPLPYQQLYAQAKHLVESGFAHWFTHEENTMLEEHKKQFEAFCPESELVRKYFRKPLDYESPLFYSATEVMARCNVEVRMLLSPNRIGYALKNMGVDSVYRKGKKGYLLVERTSEEIEKEHRELGKD